MRKRRKYCSRGGENKIREKDNIGCDMGCKKRISAWFCYYILVIERCEKLMGEAKMREPCGFVKGH